MAQTVNYAEILTEVLREKSNTRYPLQPGLKLVASCDPVSGQFLLIRIGWDKNHWHHSIVFHAQLINGKVIIEADMTEGLKPLLLEAGIRAEDFLSDRDEVRKEAMPLAA